MTQADRAELRQWAANLRPDEPLDVGDPAEDRYVRLAEAGRGEVDDIRDIIDLSYTATAQLLTGPSGSGKTTELYRLRRDLRADGYDVIVVSILDYVSRSAPLEVPEFLIALAVGAHDAVHHGEKRDAGPGFGARLGALLRRLNIELEVAGVTAKASADGIELGIPGAEVALNLKEEIRTSRPFVEQLRSKLSDHLKPLYDEVAAFLRDLRPEEDTIGAVLIVDDLEKLSGITDNDREVERSLEKLFVNEADKLRFASHHVVYTAPTYLQFISPGSLAFDSRQFVPVPHVTARGGGVDAAALSNLAELREVVRKRIPIATIFDGDEPLDALLLASGGHLREVFRILQRLLSLTLRLRPELPHGTAAVTEAINLVALDFATVTKEQADFLCAVIAAGGAVRPADADIQLMARLLRNHMLLGHRNGEYWYEAHPLARRSLDCP